MHPIDAYDDWREYTDGRDPEKTNRCKEQSLQPLLLWLDKRGIDDLDDLESNDLLQYIRHQRDKEGYANSTIRTRWYYIRMWWTWMTESASMEIDRREEPEEKLDWYESLEPASEDDPGDNPAAEIKIDKEVTETTLRKQSGQEIIYFEKPVYEGMVEACETLREELVIRILWDCGLRASELTRLDTNDVIMDENRLIVTNAKTRKDEVETRDVWYTGATAARLREWINRGGRHKYPTHTDSDSLLITQKTPEFSPVMVRKTVYEVADRAEVQEDLEPNQRGKNQKRIFPHAFRHSYAVNRVKNGMPLPYLKRLMGHASVDITEDRYIEFRPDDVHEAERRYRP
ncbi:site-specific integrase [Halorarum halophilum]|uniref:Site-specific integrase n=1 Tax=Halorarum halophilum TaxID=2743090 RepID=A0A7D5H0R9_9EURY|nr:site-specific integrase [Halobaculum halophilum]QLG28153.1 site-specific integrase [Halobaculum halophilum]